MTLTTTESFLLGILICAPILYFMWWWCGSVSWKGTRNYNKYKREKEEWRKKHTIKK